MQVKMIKPSNERLREVLVAIGNMKKLDYIKKLKELKQND